MTLEQQKQFFKDFTDKMESVMLNKGHDYSGADRLSNFKLAGTICGLKPEQNCLSLIATKVARLGQLLSSTKEPSNESIQDSVLDLANYAVLLAMLLGEDNLVTLKDTIDYPEPLIGGGLANIPPSERIMGWMQEIGQKKIK